LVSQGHQTTAGFTLVKVLGHVTTEVAQVDPKSAAYAAGLRPGDVIEAVNGQKITTSDDLHNHLGNLEGWKRGESLLVMQVARGQETKDLSFRPRTLPLYPTQLYEVVSMGLMMLLLFAYEPFRRNPGQVAAVLMVGYGVHRFLNELLRDDPR